MEGYLKVKMENLVWVVQAYGATQIQFTMDEFLPDGDDDVVILYPERTTGQTDLSPTT